VALAFPLTASVFLDTLKIRAVKFFREDYVEMSGLADGQLLTAEIAESKWKATLDLAPMLDDDAAAAQALIEAIGPHNKFNVYDPRKRGPRMDPTGSVLGSGAPVINAIGVNNRSLRFSGLPAGYRLSRGDLFSYSFSGRQTLARLAEDATATGAGITPFVEVSYPLRTGTGIGQVIRFVKPFARMQFLPGSIDYGAGEIVVTTGMSLTAIESY
jgi:hypothetical protein